MNRASPDQLPMDAAGWDSRMRSPLCSEEDREGFADWCAQSEDNRREFDALHAQIKALKDAAPVDPVLRAVIDRAVVASGERRRRSVALAASIALAVVFAAGGGYVAFTKIERPLPEVYRTNRGEQATVRLADGSVVTLNALSELRVKYRRGERGLTLSQGEALFEVAKERRPFVVTVGRREVIAHGTAFDIRTDAERFRLTMVEGKVSVHSAGAKGADKAGVPLVAGQQMSAVRNGGAVSITTIDPSKDTAWLQGRVNFEDEPLVQAVDEMNRYSVHRIVLGDRSLDQLLINGSFRTARPDNFVTAVTNYYPIVARSGAGGEIVLTRR